MDYTNNAKYPFKVILLNKLQINVYFDDAVYKASWDVYLLILQTHFDYGKCWVQK